MSQNATTKTPIGMGFKYLGYETQWRQSFLLSHLMSDRRLRDGVTDQNTPRRSMKLPFSCRDMFTRSSGRRELLTTLRKMSPLLLLELHQCSEDLFYLYRGSDPIRHAAAKRWY